MNKKGMHTHFLKHYLIVCISGSKKPLFSFHVS